MGSDQLSTGRLRNNQAKIQVLTCCLLRGRHLSYQRGKRNTNPGTSLIKIEGVDDTAAAKYVSIPNWRIMEMLI